MPHGLSPCRHHTFFPLEKGKKIATGYLPSAGTGPEFYVEVVQGLREKSGRVMDEDGIVIK